PEEGPHGRADTPDFRYPHLVPDGEEASPDDNRADRRLLRRRRIAGSPDESGRSSGPCLVPLLRRSSVLPQFDLRALGWTDELAAALPAGLSPGRIAVQHRGEYVVYAESGELRARLPGRLAYAGGLPAVGDWIGLRDGLVDVL